MQLFNISLRQRGQRKVALHYYMCQHDAPQQTVEKSDLVYPDYFVWSNVGLAGYPDNRNRKHKERILSRANANKNKGDDMQYSRTRLSGRSSGTEKICGVYLDEMPT